MVDTNVFVAAIKPFTKRVRPQRGEANTLSLLVKLLVDEHIELIGNPQLVSEYRRLAEGLRSKTSHLILERLMGKMVVVDVVEDTLRRCKHYLPAKESADVMHAATCLQMNAVLITNDSDFDPIRHSGTIEVWGISEAMRKIFTEKS